jgi:hypothetical protein
VPQAREVLLGVLTRLRSTDSVARELTEIRNRNADTQARRRIRDRLAATMTTAADQLAEGRGRGTSRSASASPRAPPAGSWPQVRNARQAAGANAT